MAIAETAVAVGTFAYTHRDTIASFFSGSDDAAGWLKPCPGQVTEEQAAHAMLNATPEEVTALKTAFMQTGWKGISLNGTAQAEAFKNPYMLAKAATGGHDCKHSGPSHVEYARLFNQLVQKYPLAGAGSAGVYTPTAYTPATGGGIGAYTATGAGSSAPPPATGSGGGFPSHMVPLLLGAAALVFFTRR